MDKQLGLRRSLLRLVGVIGLVLVASFGVSASAEAVGGTVTMSVSTPIPYVEGGDIAVTINYSDTSYDGTAVLQWYDPAASQWTTLSSSPMVAGVANTTFVIFVDGGLTSETDSIRAVVNGVVSATSAVTAQAFTSTITSSNPGYNGTYSIATNATYMTNTADLLVWDVANSEWVFERTIPLTAGQGSVGLYSDHSLYYAVAFYDATGEQVFFYSEDFAVEVFHPSPITTLSAANPAYYSTEYYEYFTSPSRVSAALAWGGFGTNAVVTMQYFAGYEYPQLYVGMPLDQAGPKDIYYDTSYTKALVDGYVSFDWTQTSGQRFRFKVRWPDGTTSYTHDFDFARYITIEATVNGQPVAPAVTPTGPSVSVPQGVPVTVSLSASGYYSGSGVFKSESWQDGFSNYTAEQTKVASNGNVVLSFIPVPGRTYSFYYVDATMSQLDHFDHTIITMNFTTFVPSVALTAPATMNPGGTATLTVAVDPAVSGPGRLQYRLPGGTWGTSSAPVNVVNGAATVTIGQSAPSMAYRVVLGAAVSNDVSIDLIVPTVSVTGPATLAPGARATLAIAVDPASSGSGQLQYRVPGGTWATSSAAVTIANGVGSVSFGQSASSMQYRVVFAGGTSNAVTINLLVPTVTVTGPASLALGARATLSVAVDPSSSGKGQLQYRVPGGTWGTSSAVVNIAGGTGAVSFGQSALSMEYRIVFGGGTSNAVTINLAVPTVTVTGPATLAPGARATLSIAVDPSSSGVGQLQYKLPGGSWGTSSAVVTIAGGTGSVSFGQSAASMDYRIVYAGGTSNAVTINLIAPTVTVTGPATLAPGARATLSIAVDPSSSGTGQLQYKLPGGSWGTSSAVVTITGGAGTVSFGQSAPSMDYRVVYAGGTSNMVTINLT